MGISQETPSRNGHDALEAKLLPLFAEQRRLREELERARAALDQVNREVLQVQEEYCTNAERAEEYDHCLQKVLGVDPRFDIEGIGQTFGEIIEELERPTALPNSCPIR
jgi:hypothetical protein